MAAIDRRFVEMVYNAQTRTLDAIKVDLGRVYKRTHGALSADDKLTRIRGILDHLEGKNAIEAIRVVLDDQ